MAPSSSLTSSLRPVLVPITFMVLAVWSLADNYTKKTPKNIVYQRRTDSDTYMKISSLKDDKNYSNIVFTNEESLQIALINGGSETAQIVFKKDGSVNITAKGTIDIKADKDMTLSATNITIKAHQELKMEGTAKGVSVKGQKIAVEADTTMDVKGLNTTVEGTAKADFKAGAMASITGAMVKIN